MTGTLWTERTFQTGSPNSKEEKLMREARSLEHTFDHRFFNPYCLHCQRAAAQRKPRLKGALALGPKTQNLKYAQAGVPAANLMPCPNSGAALRPARLDSGHPGFNPSGGNMGPNDP